MYLQQSAAHQTATRATDTAERSATDTAHCTPRHDGPNRTADSEHRRNNGEKEKKKKNEKKRKTQKKQHEQRALTSRRHGELTGSLVFDEEELQAFLKGVLVHIKLDLDSGKNKKKGRE